MCIRDSFNIAYVGFIVTLASAYRLAKFNVDDRQTNSFIGLPTPANTLFIISIPLILMYDEYAFAKAVFTNPYALIGIAIASSYMLNAEIHLFALKFKTCGFAKNKIRYLFILTSIVLIIFLQYLAIPLLIVLYVLLSLIFPDKDINYSTKNE